MPAAEMPEFSPAPGVYSDAMQVTIEDGTRGAVVHFTTDGSTPSESSQTYRGAIPVNSGEIRLRAIAVSDSHSASAEAEGIYLISPGGQASLPAKSTPSSPAQPGQLVPQPATRTSLNAGSQTAAVPPTAEKPTQVPPAESTRQESPPQQVKPPVQPPLQSTNKARPRADAADLGLQEISGAASEGMILSRTMPAYPAAAQARGVSGTVVLSILISPSGNVSKVEPVSGPPMLQQAAMDAVRTWRYRPYILEGQAVPVKTTVSVTFNLHSSR